MSLNTDVVLRLSMLESATPGSAGSFGAGAGVLVTPVSLGGTPDCTYDGTA